jgi:hypothetical protein
MANQLLTFMNRDDEEGLLRMLERYVFEVYPRRVPPDWKPFRASVETLDQFPRDDVYLVASDIGPAMVDKIKRGPDKGFWRVDEVRSPSGSAACPTTTVSSSRGSCGRSSTSRSRQGGATQRQSAFGSACSRSKRGFARTFARATPKAFSLARRRRGWSKRA